MSCIRSRNSDRFAGHKPTTFRSIMQSNRSCGGRRLFSDDVQSAVINDRRFYCCQERLTQMDQLLQTLCRLQGGNQCFANLFYLLYPNTAHCNIQYTARSTSKNGNTFFVYLQAACVDELYTLCPLKKN